jgi:hypothetical protein
MALSQTKWREPLEVKSRLPVRQHRKGVEVGRGDGGVAVEHGYSSGDPGSGVGMGKVKKVPK